MTQSVTDQIVMYGHAACPMVPPIRGMLKRANADFVYIDIHQDVEARQRVREINGGNESVPTLEFPDGSTLTEPNTGELKQKLESIGYHVPFTAVLMGNLWLILMVIGIGIALLRAFGVF